MTGKIHACCVGLQDLVVWLQDLVVACVLRGSRIVYFGGLGPHQMKNCSVITISFL